MSAAFQFPPVDEAGLAAALSVSVDLLPKPGDVHNAPALVPGSVSAERPTAAGDTRRVLLPRQAIYPARVARIGRVTGATPFAVTPEVLFDDDTIDRFWRVPVRIGHDSKRCVGLAAWPRIEQDKYIVCDLHIDVGHAIMAVELGLRHVSLAFSERACFVTRRRNGEALRYVDRFDLDHIALVRSGAHGDTRILRPGEEQREEGSEDE